MDPAGWFDSHSHLQERYVDGVEAADGVDGVEAADGSDGAEAARLAAARPSIDQPDVDQPEPSGSVAAAMVRARQAGVEGVVCVGTDPATSAQAVQLARWSRAQASAAGWAPSIWATIGLHPHEASSGTAGVAALLDEAVASDGSAVVAVGECGLDYHYNHSPPAVQRAAFAEQVALAHAHGLTLVIHARDAWDDLFAVLAAEGVPERTVLHCFTGGPAEVRRCLDAGMFVSFSGIVTFKNASDVRSAAVLCPLEHLLIETDSPFLAPVPHRGHTNQPAYVPLVGQAIAHLKGIEAAEVAASTRAAAADAFALGDHR
jgi:TatD DNase family protein